MNERIEQILVKILHHKEEFRVNLNTERWHGSRQKKYKLIFAREVVEPTILPYAAIKKFRESKGCIEKNSNRNGIAHL